MNDIIIGGKWINKDDETEVVEIRGINNNLVLMSYIGHESKVSGSRSVEMLLQDFKPAEPTITVDSVWRSKEDGELVYIESNNPSDLPYNLNFSPLGDADLYANDTKGFLGQYEFVRDKVAVAPEMSVAIGDIWQARCDGTKCKVIDIEVDNGVTWVTTQSVDDEYAVESDTLRDFFEGYRFVSKGGVKRNPTSEKGTSLLGVKHSHYHKDVSKYKIMDIYAICKVWNVEPSGCTHHALKKLLHAGERGVKSKITDLEQAIESVEALIKLEKMDIRGDS